MPGNTETNNTSEYTALLLGVRAAAYHGVTQLRVEGDSTLVIRQVRVIFATWRTRLRRLRNAVKIEIARVGSGSFHHIDRQANGHVDRLANQVLDRQRSAFVCGVHSDGTGCTLFPVGEDVSNSGDIDATMGSAPVAPDHSADIDDEEVYEPMQVRLQEVSARRLRLRLRDWNEDESEAAGAAVGRLGAALAEKSRRPMTG